MRSGLAKTLSVIVSCVIATLAAEAVMRVEYEPIDFLRPDFANDEVLRFRIQPHSAGHDAWGFRNRSVPARADIVAIGDSMTYGNGAPATGSWPSWLARETGQTVYNLGLGGLGPPDYLRLLETQALQLHPSLVIVGIYLGNDLSDTVDRVYSREHWRDLRSAASGGEPRVASPAFDPNEPAARVWMEQHSMLFRLIQGGPVGQTINRFADRSRAERARGCTVDSGSPFPTLLTPSQRLEDVDLSSPTIQDGLEITQKILTRMRRRADEAGTRLLILLIPTKETVFDGLADASRDPGCADVMRRVVSNEQIIRSRIVEELEQEGTAYVDVLPALKSGVHAGTERMFLRSGDMHPNEQGYRAIAAVIEPSVRGR